MSRAVTEPRVEKIVFHQMSYHLTRARSCAILLITRLSFSLVLYGDAYYLGYLRRRRISNVYSVNVCVCKLVKLHDV